MYGSSQSPLCAKCNVPTKFWQKIASPNLQTEVHLYQCNKCQQVFYFSLVNDVLRSWP